MYNYYLQEEIMTKEVRAVFSQEGYKDLVVIVKLTESEIPGDMPRVSFSFGFTKKHYYAEDCYAMQMAMTFISRVSGREMPEVESMLEKRLESSKNGDKPLADDIFNINLN